MGEIVVSGQKFKIKGDAPTAEEDLAIETFLGSRNFKDEETGVDILDKGEIFIKPEDVLTEAQKGKYNKDTESFLSSPTFKRLITEVGLSIAGGIAGAALAPFSGGSSLALTATSAARIARLARPLLNISANTVGKIGRASLGAAVGGGSGAAIAQSFDPKEDIVKEVARGALQGGFGEVLGFGMAGALGKAYNKVAGTKLGQLKTSKAATKIVERQKAYYNALSKTRAAGKSLTEGELAQLKNKFNLADEQIEVLKKPEIASERLRKLEDKYNTDFLDRINKGTLTPAMITDNAIVDQLQAIGESSLFGAGPLRAASTGARLGLVAGLDEFVELVTKGVDEKALDPALLGKLIQDGLTDSSKLFDNMLADGYANLNPAVRAATEIKPGLPKEGFEIILNQKDKMKIMQPKTGAYKMKNSLADYVDDTMSELKRLPGTPETEEALNVLKIAGGLSNRTTFSDLAEVTRRIAKMRVTSPDASQVKGELLNRMYFYLDNAKLPEGLKQMRNKLSNLNKLGAKEFNRGSLAKIMNTEVGQEKIYRQIMISGQKTVADDFFRKLDLKTPQGDRLIPIEQADKIKDSIRGHFFHDFVKSATKERDQYIYLEAAAARKFKNNFSKFIDDPKFVSKTQKEEMNSLIDALQYAEGSIFAPGSIGKGRGTVFIQLKEAGAISGAASQLIGGYGLASGTFDYGSAGLFILGPAALSRVFASPQIMRLITDGIKGQPKNFEQFSRLVNQLGSALVSKGIVSGADNEVVQRQVKDNQANYEKVFKGELPDDIEVNQDNPASAPSIEIDTRADAPRLGVSNQATTPNSPTVPLPNVQPSNLPLTGQSNTELAQALNLFSKGGIVSAKKSF